MSRYYRAVAIDYDGTLTETGTPHPEVLAAIRRTRGGGRLVVLVTGRIFRSLLKSFPAAEQTFDAVVAENGAVVWLPGREPRAVAPPVSPRLADALDARGVPVERGQVLLATDALHDHVVLEEIAGHGLEVQLVRNRGALMLLPPGVSKGTGLLQALAELGVSAHSTIAVGDAENDHSLLESCELGVAVANAVPALQSQADVVLSERAGRGVVQLLTGPLLRGEIRVQPKRWQIRLGSGADGGSVEIPGSQVNLLITGGSESGKSHLAGLLAERLAATGYCVAVIDPEGDHTDLETALPYAVVGGTEPLPSPDRLRRVLRLGCPVVDLSQRAPETRAVETRRILRMLAEHRRRKGTPHWIIVDEAHLTPDLGEILRLAPGRYAAGVCAVTWRPERLTNATLAAMDYVIVFRNLHREGARALRDAGFPLDRTLDLPALRRFEGWLLDRRRARRFVADDRITVHRRHWHKYQSGELPFHQRFFFRRGEHLTGAVAASMRDFHYEITRADPAVLLHHARHRDFSRWTDEVIRDHELARRLRSLEERLSVNGTDGDVESWRQHLLEVIETYYRGR